MDLDLQYDHKTGELHMYDGDKEILHHNVPEAARASLLEKLNDAVASGVDMWNKELNVNWTLYLYLKDANLLPQRYLGISPKEPELGAAHFKLPCFG